ncbi:MAG: hypothetical protein M1834_003019 [Cirrosporium novae-zelandiae]|nr:MAG: hypothetical protein M1834_003019 [Cirrosporium novae-zelandiae]
MADSTTSQQPATPTSAPTSGISTPRSIKRSHSPLSLDLSTLPPLIQPSPPSNTLLITNLNNPAIFHPATLTEIRNLISENAELYSFSPLKSFRRIICSFYSTSDAVHIRQLMDGETVFDSRARIYFGEPTPIRPTDQYLAAPKSQRLFFISPPPSPPVGWVMHNEGPPNKDVHADDLAAALAKLHARNADPNEMDTESPISAEVSGRSRSGSSTLLYCPQRDGDSPQLPAVMVEDVSDSPVDIGFSIDPEQITMAHTARPPVELMDRT